MPRSPSRDLSDRYIGKRGYFRSPDAIRRWKYVLAAGAFVAACGWAVIDVFQPTTAAYALTHGPLAGPHAAFDENCAACHVSHSPSEFGVSAVFHTRDRWHDLTCGKCHAGPDDANFRHHASATDEARDYHNRCSNCHHDHQGRLNSLVRMADADCNRCHSDLGKWHDADKSKTKERSEEAYQNAIASFATDHPDFRSLKIDPTARALKFSHAVHMAPGQTMKMTVGQIKQLANPTVADLYRKPGQADDALVSLDCASCHKLDAGVGSPDYDRLKAALDAFGEPSRALAPPRSQGAYFLPINYDANCRACHPLAANEATDPASEFKPILPRFDLPHRRNPAEIRDILKAGYVKALLAGGQDTVAKPPEPGGRFEEPLKSEMAFREKAQNLVDRAVPLLLSANTGCAKCHDTTGTGAALAIKPVPDRTVWLRHAKFNHSAHRGTSCATCHPGTDKPLETGAAAIEKEPVQIVGGDQKTRAVCVACHSPAGTNVKLPDGSKVVGGGVRSSCTDCHNYHHGDMPMQGRGAPARLPKNPRDLADWLKGK